MNGTAGQFTGVVETINVKGSGPNSAQLLFALRADNGDKMPFVVQTDSDARVFAAMTSLLTAAMQFGVRVQVSYQAAHPTNKAIEVEVRLPT